MSEKAKILFKILSLYLVTSALFLGYFFINDYEMKKEALISNEVKNLKEIKIGIYMKARMDGVSSIGAFTREKGVRACIFTQNGEKIYADENCSEARPKNVSIEGGKVAIFEAIQNMESNATDELSKAKILLFGKDIQGEILALQVKTSLNLILALAALLFVAFYLAKLALKPLYIKINTLNRFIKDSIHEINTPLSIIMMSIETADKSSLNPRNLKRMNNIELAAKNLSNIYDDLVHLTFSSGKSAKKEPIDLHELLLERLDYFAPFFAKRNLKITTHLSASSINANRYEMTKILDNLLSNAAKYTNLGGNVAINLASNAFSITNSGEGISKEQQSKIYERYTRFNSDQGGFGIGLSLVKQSCQNNDISIKCQSEPGKDTTFLLEWQI